MGINPKRPHGPHRRAPQLQNGSPLLRMETLLKETKDMDSINASVLQFLMWSHYFSTYCSFTIDKTNKMSCPVLSWSVEPVAMMISWQVFMCLVIHPLFLAVKVHLSHPRVLSLSSSRETWWQTDRQTYCIPSHSIPWNTNWNQEN